MAINIALAGNPNCGKTTLFNALTGSNQFVGNWPGVTVEKKEGKLKGHKDVTIMDLPGIYSLSPYTLEEVVSREFLLNGNVDVVLNIIDGSNLERNLFLTTQTNFNLRDKLYIKRLRYDELDSFEYFYSFAIATDLYFKYKDDKANTLKILNNIANNLDINNEEEFLKRHNIDTTGKSLKKFIRQ